MAIEVVVLPVENKLNGSVVDDDDDDCVVLNGDPENQVNSVNDSPIGFDELLVVGEKGQIACRDYPHSRHLCVKFPYSSTPHERYCGQCHCYVCDSPAPCLKWGNGLLTTDHCHATDKSESWKTLREYLKLVNTAPLSASTNNGPIGNVVNSQHNHTLLLDTGLSSISVLMNRRSRSTALCPRSFNLLLQSQAYQQILGNELSLLSSSLPNQVSRSTKTYQLTGDLLPQNQASRPISMNALSSRRSRIQNQIFNGSDSFGVQNPAIKKKRGRRVSGLGTQYTMFNGSDSFGAWNTATTNYVKPPGAPGFSNLFNPQYGGRYTAAAATGFSNGRNGYGQDGAWLTEVLNALRTQPNNSPAAQPSYQSNNNIRGNAKKSSTPSTGSSHLSFDDVKHK